MNPQWRRDAACAGEDPEVFFPERGDVRAVNAAKAICAACPVVADCREVHLGERDGIWFGTSARERKVIRRQVPGRPAGSVNRPGPEPIRVGPRYRSDAAHGTRSRFVAGCHCGPCESAEREYQRERGRRRREDARTLAHGMQVA